MTYFVGAIVILAAAVFLLVQKSRYYHRIFGNAHYSEIVSWASEVLALHPVEEPTTANGTAKVTSAGLALAYTSEVKEGRRSVHFSVSQVVGYTTGAVGNRVLFLLIRLLHKNRCEAHLSQAKSTVYHAVFSMPADVPWVLAPVGDVVTDMAHCSSLPIVPMPAAPPTATDTAP